MLTRRRMLNLIAACAALPVGWAMAAPGPAVSQEAPSLSAPPQRILLGDGHLLLALALIHPDPVPLIAAWQGDLVRHSREIFEVYAKASPALAAVPVVGEASPASFSVEAALAARPDLAIFAGCYGPGPEDTHIVGTLEAAGITVAFVDFYEDPLTNTAPSMRLLGKLLGGEATARAERFAAWHENGLATVRERIAAYSPSRPRVMLQANAGAAGWDCCWMPGSSGLGPFIEMAGGDNIGAALGSGPWVQARREYVLGSDPDTVFVTGGPFLAGRGGLIVGPGITRETALDSLSSVAQSADTAVLTAFREKRLHGLWHLLQATPFNLVALQAMARALHPDIFGDLDAEASMAAINRDFLSLPLAGTYTVDL